MTFMNQLKSFEFLGLVFYFTATFQFANFWLGMYEPSPTDAGHFHALSNTVSMWFNVVHHVDN